MDETRVLPKTRPRSPWPFIKTIVALVLFDIFMWSATLAYYLTHWKDIFR